MSGRSLQSNACIHQQAPNCSSDRAHASQIDRLAIDRRKGIAAPTGNAQMQREPRGRVEPHRKGDGAVPRLAAGLGQANGPSRTVEARGVVAMEMDAMASLATPYM
jgi:hypothetical protein